MAKPSSGVFDLTSVFKRLLTYLWRHKKNIIVAVFFMVLVALSEASFALFVEKIINKGFVQEQSWYLKWMGLIMLLLLTLRACLGYCANYFTAKLGRKVIFDIRLDIFSNLITLPTRYFDQNSSAQNVSKLIYDVETTAVATTDTLTILFQDSVKALALVCYILYLDWLLTLIFIISLPVLIYVTQYSNKRFRLTSKEIQDSMGGIADTVKEASLGQKVIKVFAGQEQEKDNFLKANLYNLNRNLKRAKVSAAVVPVTILAVAPAIALILHIYLNYLRVGPESAGQFTAYLTACVMLMSPLKRLAKVNEKIQVGVTAAHSVFQVIDAESEKDDGHKNIDDIHQSVRFHNVSFAYQSNQEEQSKGGADVTQKPTKPILDDISFTIEKGKRVALVGASGSGKSTITALILRLYQPQQGSIQIDGENIANIKLDDLRHQIALVSQEITLFDDTIARNIMYGMLDQYDEQRLQHAIKSACIDEFLDELPNGLDTLVGEQGLRLSGGQRQRIAIARAIYKNAPMLILDEATSALDNKSERSVQKALESLMKGRTSLVIAHRLSTIENADEIIVLNEGRIAEKGSHKSLIRKNGLYSELHKSQSNRKKRGLFSFSK